MQSWLPIYHDMGLTVMLVSVLGQADLWQAPTKSFAGNPFAWLKWLEESRATMTVAIRNGRSMGTSWVRRRPSSSRRRIKAGDRPVRSPYRLPSAPTAS